MKQNDFLAIKGKNKSPLTVLNYKKALKKLDLFLDTINTDETTWLERLRKQSVLELCSTWQQIIDYLSLQVSPRVTKDYFETIESYLAFNDLEIPPKKRKLHISFPRTSKSRFEGLDEKMIKRILEYESDHKMRAFYSCGFGAGMRETETLLLTPSMIRLNENPIRLILPKEITKFSIPRETFIATMPGERLKNLIYSEKIKENDYIFSEYTDTKLIEFEKHFAKIRNAVGYDTPNRKPHQQNDITLHSFRAFFTTVFMDNGLDWFGLAITGHTKYMDTYFRKSLSERQLTFNRVIDKINF